jgi:hypothetical protein
MSYASYEELKYLSYEDMYTYTPPTRPWFNNPVSDDEPVQQNRSVRFKEPITETIEFDKDAAPEDTPKFAFQVACDTVRPATNQSTLFLTR